MDMLVFLIGIMRMSWGTECENWQHLTRKKHARVGRRKEMAGVPEVTSDYWGVNAVKLYELWSSKILSIESYIPSITPTTVE